MARWLRAGPEVVGQVAGGPGAAGPAPGRARASPGAEAVESQGGGGSSAGHWVGGREVRGRANDTYVARRGCSKHVPVWAGVPQPAGLFVG